MMVLLSGLLPNPKLETSVLSIIIRVSNELGAGHPEAAHLVVHVALALVIVEGLLLGIFLISIHNIWGYAYTNEAEVVKCVAKMLPILQYPTF
ncbi:hypothetical protein FEM48_Zijuj05G0096600 [Ziziphus jujuba var. spinosa]|uniref:Uncharacterized protein n=1 Tax=Ziziphus jujuba var. spinosa TaxID=714518 RepID=A0A978VE80_ZIZJJ|nr:hypothetical protein FEM48_Zijuj05G0096600 [Ziziphus jujuba var. spinosa]